MAESQPLKWKYISKIDDDSFLDARTFYRQYLVPLKSRRRTIIARTLHQPDFTVPGGQFYTLTSDMVSLLASLHVRNPISNEAEDVLVGRLLHEAKVDWKHVDLPNPVAFDYEPKELRSKQKAFADAGADLGGWSHAVGPGAINPHKMRDDNAYVEVAACFDERGVIVHAN